MQAEALKEKLPGFAFLVQDFPVELGAPQQNKTSSSNGSHIPLKNDTAAGKSRNMSITTKTITTDAASKKDLLNEYCRIAVHYGPHGEIGNMDDAQRQMLVYFEDLSIESIDELQDLKGCKSAIEKFPSWMYTALYDSNAVASAWKGRVQTSAAATGNVGKDQNSSSDLNSNSDSESTSGSLDDENDIVPDSVPNHPDFLVLPMTPPLAFELSQFLERAGGFNKFDVSQRKIRTLIASNLKASGPNLYQFILSPAVPQAGSGMDQDALNQVHFMEYCHKVETTSEWVTNVEINIAAKIFDVTFFIWQFNSTEGYSYYNRIGTGKNVIHLGFESELHYHLLLHCSDPVSINRLLPYLKATPVVVHTSPFQGQRAMVAVGIYGDGNCFYTALAAAALALDHPISRTFEEPVSNELVAVYWSDISTMSIMDLPSRACITDTLKSTYILYEHLCAAAGRPLTTPRSVVYDGTIQSAVLLVAPAGIDALRLHQDTVIIGRTDDYRDLIKTKNSIDAVAFEVHKKLGYRPLISFNKHGMPDLFSGCTHIIFDDINVSSETVHAACQTDGVQIVICHSRTMKHNLVSVEIKAFRRVKILRVRDHDPAAKDDRSRTITLLMFVRTEEQSPTEDTKVASVISNWIRDAKVAPDPLARASRATDSIVAHGCGSKVQQFRCEEKDVKYVITPQVAVSVFEADQPAKTFLPNERVMLKGDSRVKEEVVTFLGVVDRQGGSSGSLLIYENSAGSIGATGSDRLSPSDRSLGSSSKNSKEIAKALRKLLKTTAPLFNSSTAKPTQTPESDPISKKSRDLPIDHDGSTKPMLVVPMTKPTPTQQSDPIFTKVTRQTSAVSPSLVPDHNKNSCDVIKKNLTLEFQNSDVGGSTNDASLTAPSPVPDQNKKTHPAATQSPIPARGKSLSSVSDVERSRSPVPLLDGSTAKPTPTSESDHFWKKRGHQDSAATPFLVPDQNKKTRDLPEGSTIKVPAATQSPIPARGKSLSSVSDVERSISPVPVLDGSTAKPSPTPESDHISKKRGHQDSAAAATPFLVPDQNKKLKSRDLPDGSTIKVPAATPSPGPSGAEDSTGMPDRKSRQKKRGPKKRGHLKKEGSPKSTGVDDPSDQSTDDPQLLGENEDSITVEILSDDETEANVATDTPVVRRSSSRLTKKQKKAREKEDEQLLQIEEQEKGKQQQIKLDNMRKEKLMEAKALVNRNKTRQEKKALAKKQQQINEAKSTMTAMRAELKSKDVELKSKDVELKRKEELLQRGPKPGTERPQDGIERQKLSNALELEKAKRLLDQQLSAHQEAARNMQAKASEDERSERAEYLISMRQQFEKLQEGLNNKQQDDFKAQLLHAVERNKPEPMENVLKAVAALSDSLYSGIAKIQNHQSKPVEQQFASKHPPVCINDLSSKKLSEWSVPDVQRWLAHSNQPDLQSNAAKHTVDGKCIILFGVTPDLVKDIWPSLSKFETVRLNNSIIACRQAYE